MIISTIIITIGTFSVIHAMGDGGEGGWFGQCLKENKLLLRMASLSSPHLCVYISALLSKLIFWATHFEPLTAFEFDYIIPETNLLNDFPASCTQTFDSISPLELMPPIKRCPPRRFYGEFSSKTSPSQLSRCLLSFVFCLILVISCH